jgi:Kef-type K+ transport system membrane component KefB/Trk K+ transport system NAD-binding subunit
MEHESWSTFEPLLIVTLLAVVVPVLTSRLRVIRLPIVVGEILAGMAIGPSGLNLVHPSPLLSFLAEFGFSFLMFLSGLEVNFDMLFAPGVEAEGRPRWQRPLPLAILYLLLTLALATAIGWGISAGGLARSPVLMGLILSTTSLGLVVPILKERGLTPTPYGQLLLVSALVSDFVTLLLLSVAMAAYSKGLSVDLLLFMLLLVAFAIAMKLGQWLTRNPVLSRIVDELSHATAQIRVRGAFALMVVWVVLAQALGVEVILGAFLAGALVAATSREPDSPMRESLDAMGYGFFVPMFFIMVGAKFELGSLLASPSSLLLVPVLMAAAYAVKMGPALLFRVAFSWRETFAAGALLSSRLSLIIAASAIALQLDLITAPTNSAILLVAIVTCTISPVLFSKILPPEQAVQRQGVVILGTDQLAVLLGQRLRDAGEPVTFIGRDQPQLHRLEQLGFVSVAGSPEDADVLQKAGLETARALIAVSNAPEMLLSICRQAQERFGVPSVIARCDDSGVVRELEALEVSVVQPSMATALALEAALHFPTAFGMLLNKSDGVEVADVPLRNPLMDGRPLRRIRLPGNALVMGLHRGGEFVVPHGDTVLRVGDVLVLLGSADALREARQWLAPR